MSSRLAPGGQERDVGDSSLAQRCAQKSRRKLPREKGTLRRGGCVCTTRAAAAAERWHACSRVVPKAEEEWKGGEGVSCGTLEMSPAIERKWIWGCVGGFSCC